MSGKWGALFILLLSVGLSAGTIWLWWWGAGVRAEAAVLAAASTNGNGPSAAEIAGLLGDSYGKINALFSGLAFVGVVIALLVQGRELGQAEKDQKASSDALFRAAYVDAVRAVRDTPPVEDMWHEQWVAAEKLRILVEKLDVEAAKVFGAIDVPNIRDRYVIRSLQTLSDTMMLHVPADCEENPVQPLQAQALHNYVATRMRPRLEQLLVALGEKFSTPSKTVFVLLAELENMERRRFENTELERKAFVRFWGACHGLERALQDIGVDVVVKPFEDPAAPIAEG